MARKGPGQSEVCGSCARRPHPAPILPAAPRRSPPLSHRSRRERLIEAFRDNLADAYRAVGRDEDAEALLDPPPASDGEKAGRPED